MASLLKKRFRNRVFISYSHKDREWLEALQVHLRPLEREGKITRWDDTLIQSGSQWKDEIRRALSEARVAVLLVSKYFLASDFIAENELPPLLQAAELEGAVIFPVIIGPCRFSRTTSLSDYQAVNSPDRTLVEMTPAEQDRVWLNLTDAIEDVLSTLSEPELEMQSSLYPREPLAVPTTNASSAGAGCDERLAPDLYILVHHGVADGRPILSFQIKAKDASLGVVDKLYPPVPLSKDLRLFFGELFRDIERLSGGQEGEIAKRKLESKGNFLFERLLPAELGDLLWELQGRVKTVLVQSNEGIIPWELFKLWKRRQSGMVEEGPFLCEAFALTRWITGFEPQMEFPFESVAWIAPKSGPEWFIHGDRPVMLEAQGISVNEIPPTFIAVHDALASGRYDTLHFSTHSSTAGGDPSRWKLYLEDQEGLTPEDLVGHAGNLGVTRPLVFLNACQTGLNSDTITGVSGWATQFIRAGCGAFVGSYWNLSDESASAFQEAFYRHFLAGEPLGEAVRLARQDVKCLGDPTWLSYTAYSHPEARARLNKVTKSKIA